MRKRKRYTSEDAENLRRLRAMGLTDGAIAEAMGRHRSTINKWAQELDLPPAKRGRPVGTYTPDERVLQSRKKYAGIISDHEAGMHPADIASKYGISTVRVYQILTKHKPNNG